MRRRRSRRARQAAARLALAATGITGATSTATGQVDMSGPAFLLFPVSARSVGVGGALTGEVPGSDAVLANPAAYGRMTRSEAGLHYGQDALTNRILAGAAFRSEVLGTLAASALIADLGEMTLTDPNQTPVGSASVRNVLVAASYGGTVGSRAAVGVTFKYLQLRFDCTGECEEVSAFQGSSTSAVDFGAQYDVTGRLAVGAAVRNVGLRLQVQDREQADPLPAQVSVGARYLVRGVERYAKDTELRVLGQVDRGVGSAGGGTAFRIGAEGLYRRAFALRAGYAHGTAVGDGPAVGLGYATTRFGFDLATQLAGFSVDIGQAPTFVAFRYWF